MVQAVNTCSTGVKVQFGLFHDFPMHGVHRLRLLDDARHGFERLSVIGGKERRHARLADKNGGFARWMVRQNTNGFTMILDLALDRVSVRQLDCCDQELGPAGMDRASFQDTITIRFAHALRPISGRLNASPKRHL